MSQDIGKKINELRKQRKLTLKEVSAQTGLSTGFLSQFERGLSFIATDSLEKIADALGVDVSMFFPVPVKDRSNTVLRSYEKEVSQIVNSKFINYVLTTDRKDKRMLTRLVELLPIDSNENIEEYNHLGEESVYVLEGILTLFLGSERYELYPGDSAHYNSTLNHNWANYTSKMVRILVTSC